MAKAVKLADIAAKVNVSTVTVSKALSDQKGVSEELRDKIKNIAEEMGYKQPSVMRKERIHDGIYKKPSQSYNLGVIIYQDYLDKYDSFYWQMYQMVTTQAVANGCFTMFEVVSSEDIEQNTLPKLILEQKIEGLIVIGYIQENYLENVEEQSDLPLIYLDFCNEKKKCDAVISDSYYGAYMMTNYLYEMGHQRIAFVGTPRATGSITDRYLGFCKSLMEHGEDFPVRSDWLIPDRDENNGKIDTENLMVLPEDMPSAFLCNCDLTASELIRKLENKGYRIPEDVSVVGYDNYLFPGLCDVEITTYEVDMKEMAKRSVRTLLKKIKGESYRKGISIVEGHMVLKESVKDISEE